MEKAIFGVLCSFLARTFPSSLSYSHTAEEYRKLWRKDIFRFCRSCINSLLCLSIGSYSRQSSWFKSVYILKSSICLGSNLNICYWIWRFSCHKFYRALPTIQRSEELNRSKKLLRYWHNKYLNIDLANTDQITQARGIWKSCHNKLFRSLSFHLAMRIGRLISDNPFHWWKYYVDEYLPLLKISSWRPFET